MLIEKARAAGNDKAIYAEAIGKLRRALAVDGDSMPAYALLALIYYTVAESDRSKLDLAELVCTQAKEVNANYAPIYNTLGLIKLRKKNVTGALTEFRKAAELDPPTSRRSSTSAPSRSRRATTPPPRRRSRPRSTPTRRCRSRCSTPPWAWAWRLRGQKRFDEAEPVVPEGQGARPEELLGDLQPRQYCTRTTC